MLFIASSLVEHLGRLFVDHHGGDALHVLQSVGVEVHQEPPDAGAHGGEGQRDGQLLAWTDIVASGGEGWGQAVEAFSIPSAVLQLLAHLLDLDLGCGQESGPLHREDAAPQRLGERVGEGDVGAHFSPHNSFSRNLEEHKITWLVT